MSAVRRLAVALSWLWGLSSCSADAAPEPEPTLETKGAFFAVVADSGDLELFRTLAVLGEGKDNDAFFVVPLFDPE